MITAERLRPEVFFNAVRSRGPGGQNVNRTSSAAILYWDYRYSNLLTDAQKARVAVKMANVINVEDQVYLRSDEFRDLERNKSRCLEKLAALVTEAIHVPKRRRATKPTWGSKMRKLEGKSRRGEIKRLRAKVKE